jgi:hypothetical protein
LLVSSLGVMVQIVEHRADTSTDFLVEEEAVSSTPQVPNRPGLGTAARGVNGYLFGYQFFGLFLL